MNTCEFDFIADEIIDFKEMKLVFRCFLDQSPSLDLEETLDELTASLFKETDVDQSGDITLEELTNALKRNEHLFKVLSLRFDRKREIFFANRNHVLLVQAIGFNRNHCVVENYANVHRRFEVGFGIMLVWFSSGHFIRSSVFVFVLMSVEFISADNVHIIS